MSDIEIILPARTMDALCDGLCAITEAIHDRDPEAVAHGFLGGDFGYGGQWNSAVFEMRPFYWGDCDCGSNERNDAWCAKNPHAPDCWQTERDRRWKAYDVKVGWGDIEKAAFGDDSFSFMGGFDEETTNLMPGMSVSVFQPRKDPAMARWRKAHDARDKAHARIVRDLYDKWGLPRQPYQWHCTCGRDERAHSAELGHLATCAVELPNFRHKATGFEVRWYKYIGRDMQTLGEADISAVVAECLSDVRGQTLSRQQRPLAPRSAPPDDASGLNPKETAPRARPARGGR